MAVRSDYRVVGMKTDEVRALQRMIGVAPDGAWGNKSQTMLNAYYGANADPLAVYKGLGATAGPASTPEQQTGQPPLSNYTGNYYTGKGGSNYTDYGALIRNDGFYYPEGAKVSPNGMYVDVGNGWQFAKYGVAFDKYGPMFDEYGRQQRLPSSVTGLAPGARVPGTWSSNSGGTTDPGGTTAEPGTNQPKTEWELFLERELKRYQEEWLSGYVEMGENDGGLL